MKKQTQPCKMETLYSPWSETLDEGRILQDYPRPQMVRDSYLNLNGNWDYKIIKTKPRTPLLSGEILVPFAPPTLLSKVPHILQVDETLIYHKIFYIEKGFIQQITLLHFGAVDQKCRVYLNNSYIGNHQGGYLPFHFDVTSLIKEGNNELMVEVEDLTDTSYFSFGKQTLEHGGMWYTPMSGIWQTVWLESVPSLYIQKIKLTPNIDEQTIHIDLHTNKPFHMATIEIYRQNHELLVKQEISSPSIDIKIDDMHVWSPEDPYLYPLTIQIENDRITSYFAMRKFSIGQSSFGPCLCLNNHPYFMNGLLDQGYISDGGYTYCSDEALKSDILEMKKLGFNTLRKHIKIEPLRWYYHCDQIGMIVWQDFINGGCYDYNLMTLFPTLGFKKFKDDRYIRFGRDDEKAKAVYYQELEQTMDLLYNSPSIAVWVCFNEGWGQFDAKRIASLVKEKDPTRIVDHASGWFDQGGDDLHSIHVYFRKVRIKKEKRPTVVSEFGGYSHQVEGHIYNKNREYGYRRFKYKEEYLSGITKLYQDEIIPCISKGLAACIYTQVSDVEDETNGILTYDRRVNKLADTAFVELMKKLKIKEE